MCVCVQACISVMNMRLVLAGTLEPQTSVHVHVSDGVVEVVQAKRVMQGEVVTKSG